MTRAPALFRSAHSHTNGFGPRAGFRPFDPIDAESTLGARFREVALRRRAATALVCGETSISYLQLLQRANALAARLRSQWGLSGGVVGICLRSGLETIETMLGALLGGFGYFCIDPSLPEKQIVKLVDAADLVGVAGREPAAGHIPKPSLNTRGPAGIAALYATSGSTGEPKLVAISHRAVLFDIGRQSNDLYLGPDDRFDALFSFAFSASLATVFGALLNGAELLVQDPRLLGTGLLRWIEDQCITVSTMTVSMLRHACLTRPNRGACPSLRLLSVGGEPLLASDVAAFRSVFAPSCVLQNAMASTETRTYAQYFVPPSGPVPNPVPIGWPAAGKEVILLDEQGAPAPPGTAGEISVRSAYLADGYSNDPQRTAAKFHAQSGGAMVYRTGDCGLFQADGSLIFLGRADSLVKIRGHRVELHAVCEAIHRHSAVQTSVVVTREDPAGNLQLVAYVVARENASVAEGALRAFLRDHLPPYAVPAAFVFVRGLPLNPNGKIDLRNLPAAQPGAAESGTSSGSAMEILREIWEEVLQRPHISADDGFFDLGGDSLSAVRVLVAIHERLHCELPFDSLQRFPTLKDLAACVEHAAGDEAPPGSLVVFQEGGAGTPFFFVPGMDGCASGYGSIASGLGRCHPIYGFSFRLGAAGNSLESLAKECVEQVHRVVPRGRRVVLVGYSFGATVAFEIARQLRGSASHDPLPILIDMPVTNARGVLPPPLWRQALDVALNIPAWVIHEAVHLRPRKFLVRAQGRLARIGGALLRPAAAPQFDPRIFFGTASIPAAYRALLSGRYEALLRYRPARYEGKVILLRAQVPTLFRSRDTRMGWQAVAADGVEVYPVPGRHDDCIAVGRAAELAQLLTRCVEGILEKR